MQVADLQLVLAVLATAAGAAVAVLAARGRRPPPCADIYDDRTAAAAAVACQLAEFPEPPPQQNVQRRPPVHDPAKPVVNEYERNLPDPVRFKQLTNFTPDQVPPWRCRARGNRCFAALSESFEQCFLLPLLLSRSLRSYTGLWSRSCCGRAMAAHRCARGARSCCPDVHACLAFSPGCVVATRAWIKAASQGATLLLSFATSGTALMHCWRTWTSA